MQAIHQITAGLLRGDAIGNEAFVLRDLFRSWGCDSQFFSEPRHVNKEVRAEVTDVHKAAHIVRPDDIVLLHLSMGSPVNDLFRELRCRKAILYHNITPPHYFRGILNPVARDLQKGRDQMAALKDSAAVVMAVSEFNAGELRAAGYRDVKILPLVLDLSRLRGETDRGTLHQYSDGRINVLFVGRCVPNKKIEDALQAFYYFQKFVEPNARFVFAGSYTGLAKYHALLLTVQRDLELENVEMTGPLPQSKLNALYRTAHLFLCTSEHEGFCIPLIESMVHDVPVLAYAAAAIPETLDGAGVLFREKKYDQVGEMMGRLVRDQAFRAAVIRGQRERLARYEKRDLGAELRQHLAPLLKD